MRSKHGSHSSKNMQKKKKKKLQKKTNSRKTEWKSQGIWRNVEPMKPSWNYCDLHLMHNPEGNFNPKLLLHIEAVTAM